MPLIVGYSTRLVTEVDPGGNISVWNLSGGKRVGADIKLMPALYND